MQKLGQSGPKTLFFFFLLKKKTEKKERKKKKKPVLTMSVVTVNIWSTNYEMIFIGSSSELTDIIFDCHWHIGT